MQNRRLVRWSICCCIVILRASVCPAEDLKISAPPEDIKRQFKLDQYYRKCVVTRGFPIVASDKVSDMALL